MTYHTWQVGIDIQNGQLCALAVLRRRQGWQLRHWFRTPLPDSIVQNGQLQRSPALTHALRILRRRLPRRHSLRVGYPPHAVQQHRLAAPGPAISARDRKHYLAASARRLFPIDPAGLAIDARDGAAESLVLTATRRETIDSWLSGLADAELEPEVLELTPNALSVTAGALALPQDQAVVYALADHWLWLRRAAEGPVWGWASRDDIADVERLRQQMLPGSGPFWFSASTPQPQPAGSHPLQPLRAVALQQPPLPDYPDAFTLALGLALRVADSQ
ncbi:hypothetical protein [Pantoea sp. 1.19]|uniref:hypothetical protein n=1 Tax=Pantoea sp. 1.19 TaxID=1925589 RepID=UPI0009488BB3|nr:hypothetical protein [Pantoea sp. 1.19]